MPRIHALFTVLTGIVLVSCAGHTTPGPGSYFLHSRHREAFAFEPNELSGARFYVQRDLLARDQPPGPGVGEADVGVAGNGDQAREALVYVTMEDIGQVIDGGPDWLRVRFGTGTGIVFLTDAASGDPTYYLATEIAGRPGFHIVKNLDDQYLMHDGQRLAVELGADTALLINSEDLQGLMDARQLLWKSRSR